MSAVYFLLTGRTQLADGLDDDLAALARRAAQMVERTEHAERQPHEGGFLSRLIGRGRARPAPASEGAAERLLVLFRSAGVTQRSRSSDAMLRRWIGELADFLGIEDPVARWEAEEPRREQERGRGEGGLLRRLFERERGPPGDPWTKSSRPLPASCTAPPARPGWHFSSMRSTNSTPRHTNCSAASWPCCPKMPACWPRPFQALRPTCLSTLALPQAPSPVPPMQRDEAEAIIRAIWAAYHWQRALTDRLVAEVLAHTNPRGCPSWQNALWLELTVEAIARLDGHDYDRLETDPRCTSLPDYPARVEQLLAHTAADMAGDGAGGAQRPSSGPHERSEASSQWYLLWFALFRRTLMDHIIQKGTHGHWYFHRAQPREAVLRRYVSYCPDGVPSSADVYLAVLGCRPTDVKQLRRVHRAVADYLLGLPDDNPVRSEIMFHPVGTYDRYRAAEFYTAAHVAQTALNIEHDFSSATQVLAEAICTAEHRPHNDPVKWTTALLTAAGESETTHVLCRAFIFRLNDALQVSNARLVTRDALMQETLTAMQRLVDQVPTDAEWQRNLSVSHERVGDLLMAQGDLEGAREHYQSDLEIAERLVQSDPNNAVWQRDPSVSYNRMAMLSLASRHEREAVQWLRTCLELLQAMRARRVHLDPQAATILRRLEDIFGPAP